MGVLSLVLIVIKGRPRSDIELAALDDWIDWSVDGWRVSNTAESLIDL